MNDVFEAARNKIGPSIVHSFFNSEGSYSRAGEYYILSPLRGDKHVSSFHINEDSGQWFDHATDEGGDFIELVSKARGISLKDAAEDIISETEKQAQDLKNLAQTEKDNLLKQKEDDEALIKKQA